MKKLSCILMAALAAVCLDSCNPEDVPDDPKDNPIVPEKEHVHKLQLVYGQAPTTTEAGWKDYYRCLEVYEPCGLFWEDSKAEILIGDETALAAWKAEGGNGYLAKLDDPTPGPTPTPENAGANCYIVAPGASVSVPLLRGVSEEALQGVASAEVLWETLNTSTAPAKGDVVASAQIASDGKSIKVTASNKPGNAVVAAKSSDGTILWSWHIWVCDFNPNDNTCVFNAGTMMDRNLGALTNKPAEVTSFGLMYQWGRKDPFPGSALLTDNTTDQRAATSVAFPSPVESSSSKGTIEYAIKNPMTFITLNRQNFDWNYTGGGSIDETRWTRLSEPKGVYDPCPKGWRIPEGGLGGFWCTVFGVTELGMEAKEPAGAGWWQYKAGWFISVDGAANGGYWFPCPGQIQAVNKCLKEVGEAGYYCNTTLDGAINSMNITCVLIESWLGDIEPCIRPIENQFIGFSDGESVRCVKE